MVTFKKYHNQFSNCIVAPYYHLVSSSVPPHINQLFSGRSVTQFLNDIDFFLLHYNIVDLHQMINYVVYGEPLPSNPLFLSFDDGLKEVYDVVISILSEKGVPATFFVCNQFIDNKELFYRHKASLLLNHLENNTKYIKETEHFFEVLQGEKQQLRQQILSIRYHDREILDQLARHIGYDFQDYLQTYSPYLTTHQIKTLLDKGFTIGSHSVNHPNYSELSLNEQIEQTRQGMEYVQHQFNLPYKAFAFPFNDNRVSTRFYKTVVNEKITDITFGTSGLIDDVGLHNIQRCKFENTAADAKAILSQCYSDKNDRILLNKDLIKRPFC